MTKWFKVEGQTVYAAPGCTMYVSNYNVNNESFYSNGTYGIYFGGASCNYLYGLPKTAGVRTVYDVSAEEFASYVPALAEAGVSIFGGCCGTDEHTIAALKEALANVILKVPARGETDLLPCATERDVFLLQPDASYAEVFPCDDDLEDALAEAEPGELIAVSIETEEDLAAFSDCQYAVANPLCILCDDASLLERTLRCYQGRALYEGALPDDALLPLAQKYGLIF